VIGGTTYGNGHVPQLFDAANQAFGQGLELTSDTFGSGTLSAFSSTGWNSWKRSTRIC